MKIPKLITKEFKIMKILWSSENPIYIADIAKASNKKIEFVELIIKKLVKKEFIICKNNEYGTFCLTVIDIDTFNKDLMDKILGDPILKSFLNFW